MAKELNPAIIVLERHLDNIKNGYGMVNIHGMTKTEIDEMEYSHAQRVKPFEDSIKILKDF